VRNTSSGAALGAFKQLFITLVGEDYFVRLGVLAEVRARDFIARNGTFARLKTNPSTRPKLCLGISRNLL